MADGCESNRLTTRTVNPTHHTVHDCMFAEQNYFPGCTDKPLSILFGTLLRDSKRCIVIEGKLFNCAADGVTFMGQAGSDVSLVLVCTSCEGNGAGVEEGSLEVIE